MDLEGTKQFVFRYISERINPSLHYHDLSHTLDVHEAAIRIARMEQVSGDDLELIETAALFHDIGMTEQYDDHETASVNIAEAALPRFGYTAEQISVISALILATKLPSGPLSLNEEILCDADLDYLGRDDFFMRSFQLQSEWNVLGIRETTPVEWLEFESAFMQKHDYFTASARAIRGPGKERNLKYISHFLGSSYNQ